MSKLENIVPSIELCKKIPAGEFEDTALVWKYDRICGFICLVPGHPDETARLRNDGIIYPAPTLVEILKKIPDCVEVIRMKEHNHCMKATGLPLVHESSLADCALRLWLKLRGIEVKMMSEEKRKPEPLTNGDRLRAMSNEELERLNICPKDFDWNFVCNFRKPCGKCLLDWLNSPAESEVNHE